MAHRDETVCEHRVFHPEKINKARKHMCAEEDLAALAETFSVLGDYTRVRILNALSVGELCVCDLTAVLGVSQSAVSHQLRLLRAAKLVKYRREGKRVIYTLDDEHVEKLFAEGLHHVQEDKPLKKRVAKK
jgi:DNA-binding transcriptional ArsR family regulator